MTPEEETRRGEAARRLLADPLLREAFAAVEEHLRSTWLATTDDEAQERERLWMMLRLLRRVRGHLEAVLEHGRLARHEIDAVAERSLRNRTQ